MSIHIGDVSVQYSGSEESVLHGIGLDIEPGTVTLICGASGSGKSSVLRLINGLIPHFHTVEGTGTVTVDGHNVAETEVHQMGTLTATVFQNPRTQFFTTDVDSELAFAGENYQLPPDTIRARSAEALEYVGISDLAGRNLWGLSGGQLQKVACAQAYAQDTPILLFDEPTSNLDPESIEDFTALLRRLKEQGKTLVIAEHRVYFLAGIVDRVILVEDGRIAQEFTGEEFFQLNDARRRDLGLRCLSAPELTVPEQEPGDVPGLHIDSAVVSFQGKRVLDISGVVFPAGQVTGLVGPNGAGKTTLARVLCGLQKMDRGTPKNGIRLVRAAEDGASISEPMKKGTAFLVMQDVHRQLFAETVAQEADAQHLEQLGLGKLADRHPMSLSGGQKQRLVIATALSMNTHVLILDEPTSGVDYRHLVDISEQLKKLAARGVVVIVISHDHEFLNHCADRIVHLNPLTGKE